MEEVGKEGEGLGHCQYLICERDERKCDGGRDRHTLSTPVDDSSSGKLRTCSVICTSVRGIMRTRIMLRKVLCRRSSRWRSRGPDTKYQLKNDVVYGIESAILPTPTAGRTFTSIVASSGISSFLNTSIGPLTAPMME